MSTTKRVRYYDTLKFWCILAVPIFHFLSYFEYDFERYYYLMPYAIFTRGLFGKIFIIILGQVTAIVAYNSRKKNLIGHILIRYLFFVLCGLLMNATYVILGLSECAVTPLLFIENTFSLGNAIYSVFWWLRPFFVSSVVAYIDKHYGANLKVIMLQILLFGLAGCNWTAICLMGVFVTVLCENKRVQEIFQKKSTWLIVFLFIFVIIKREQEGVLTYYIDSVCVVLVMLIFLNSAKAKNALDSCKLSARAGKYTMPIVMNHYVFMRTFIGKLHESEFAVSLGKYPRFAFVFIIYMAIVLVTAIPIQKFLDWCMKYIKSYVDNHLNLGTVQE